MVGHEARAGGVGALQQHFSREFQCSGKYIFGVAAAVGVVEAVAEGVVQQPLAVAEIGIGGAALQGPVAGRQGDGSHPAGSMEAGEYGVRQHFEFHGSTGDGGPAQRVRLAVEGGQHFSPSRLCVFGRSQISVEREEARRVDKYRVAGFGDAESRWPLSFRVGDDDRVEGVGAFDSE